MGSELEHCFKPSTSPQQLWQSECPESPAAQMLVSEEKLRAVFDLMDQNQDALVNHPVRVAFFYG